MILIFDARQIVDIDIKDVQSGTLWFDDLVQSPLHVGVKHVIKCHTFIAKGVSDGGNYIFITLLQN